ncbi:hypothetical protein [Nocardia sp.]|uniref:hypothetical protein n=1 Tax=Nocardia sp. TaxID=1821 RepID=UPI002617D73A|nr:hypothetical protein [Nocardia sp.]
MNDDPPEEEPPLEDPDWPELGAAGSVCPELFVFASISSAAGPLPPAGVTATDCAAATAPGTVKELIRTAAITPRRTILNLHIDNPFMMNPTLRTNGPSDKWEPHCRRHGLELRSTELPRAGNAYTSWDTRQINGNAFDYLPLTPVLGSRG